MRNVFDQFSLTENRVTHALITALNEDRKLLDLFLRGLLRIRPPCNASELKVCEQTYPDQEELTVPDPDRRGLPDGWIYHDDGWSILIESKVTAPFERDQISRHLSTAKRWFKTTTAVAITAHAIAAPPDKVKTLEWSDVYLWLREHDRHHKWARRLAEFLEIVEAQMTEDQRLSKGTLTTFRGINFDRDRPYTHLEAKRLLKMAMSSLRDNDKLLRALGVDPHTPSRGSITGGDLVWDVLVLGGGSASRDFTVAPHLTLSIGRYYVDALVTIPNAVSNKVRKKITEIGEDGLLRIMSRIVSNIRSTASAKGAKPIFRGHQRHFHARRKGISDALIEFNMDTALRSTGPTKMQRLWFSAAYGAFIDKGTTNYEIQLGARFSYEDCEGIRKPEALKLIADTWLACKPFVDLIASD